MLLGSEVFGNSRLCRMTSIPYFPKGTFRDPYFGCLFSKGGTQRGEDTLPRVSVLFSHKHEHWRHDVVKQALKHLRPINRTINIRQRKKTKARWGKQTWSAYMPSARRHWWKRMLEWAWDGDAWRSQVMQLALVHLTAQQTQQWRGR